MKGIYGLYGMTTYSPLQFQWTTPANFTLVMGITKEGEIN